MVGTKQDTNLVEYFGSVETPVLKGLCIYDINDHHTTLDEERHYLKGGQTIKDDYDGGKCQTAADEQGVIKQGK